MNYIKSLFFSTCAFLGLSVFGQDAAAPTLTNNASAVKDSIDELTGYAINVFDGVTPVILAVVGLGILLVFAKRIKKS